MRRAAALAGLLVAVPLAAAATCRHDATVTEAVHEFALCATLGSDVIAMVRNPYVSEQGKARLHAKCDSLVAWATRAGLTDKEVRGFDNDSLAYLCDGRVVIFVTILPEGETRRAWLELPSRRVIPMGDSLEPSMDAR